MTDTRVERDTMGEVTLPAGALYGATTQRAVENFPISGEPLPPELIHAIGLIKQAAARVNRDLGLLPPEVAAAIENGARAVAAGELDDHFPIDVFQTGSGTSSNMNANEVIAAVASQELGRRVHPNDEVNLGQSSNDVIPTALHVAALLAIEKELLPALRSLRTVLSAKASAFDDVVKIGRTHLMDAVPIRMGKEFSGYARQIELASERITATLLRAPVFIQVDNVRGRLDSASLSVVLTAPTYTDRVLGYSNMVSIPVRSVWLATGNNIGMSNEVARRSAWISSPW